MPELPEVQTVVDTLGPAVVGRGIAGVDLRRADILTPAGLDLAGRLVGRTIATVHRRGKRIVFQLADGNRFYIHLGMTGRLTMEAAGAALLPHTHLIITFDIPPTTHNKQPTTKPTPLSRPSAIRRHLVAGAGRITRREHGP